MVEQAGSPLDDILLSFIKCHYLKIVVSFRNNIFFYFFDVEACADGTSYYVILYFVGTTPI